MSKIENGQGLKTLLPMPPKSGPPLPKVLNIRWPWGEGESVPEKMAKNITEALKKRGLV